MVMGLSGKAASAASRLVEAAVASRTEAIRLRRAVKAMGVVKVSWIIVVWRRGADSASALVLGMCAIQV
jgi:Tfp pilus assembly protein FimT